MFGKIKKFIKNLPFFKNFARPIYKPETSLTFSALSYESFFDNNQTSVSTRAKKSVFATQLSNSSGAKAFHTQKRTAAGYTSLENQNPTESHDASFNLNTAGTATIEPVFMHNIEKTPVSRRYSMIAGTPVVPVAEIAVTRTESFEKPREQAPVYIQNTSKIEQMPVVQNPIIHEVAATKITTLSSSTEESVVKSRRKAAARKTDGVVKTTKKSVVKKTVKLIVNAPIENTLGENITKQNISLPEPAPEVGITKKPRTRKKKVPAEATGFGFSKQEGSI
jgi:hypothetical protein